MPFAARAYPAALTTLLAVLAVAPVAGASQRAVVRAPDGLKATPDAARGGGAHVRRSAVNAHAAQVAAGDPRAAEQWPFDGDGPMGIESAWRQTTGGGVTVAIVDSGADLGHPDLAPNLWTNPGEVPGNGVDDDGNGYVDDVHGFDFVESDGTPQDGNGHGTHVAGIVGARGGNGVGVAGVAWSVRLMVVRVLDAAARGTTTDVARGIRYAVDNGARIVNLSLAGPTSTPDLQDAVAYAQAHGVLIVAAAGNDGANLANAPTYPAAYGEEDVLGVAATRQDGGLSGVSDYGPGADLAAPGEGILSTALGGGYEWRTGTSMAAPEVAGALVLIAAARPDLDAAGLRSALLAGTRKVGLPVATGALDVGSSLRAVIPASAWIDASVAPLSGYTSSTRTTTKKKAKAKTKAKKKPKQKAKAKKAKKKLTAAQKRARAKKAAARKRAAARRAAARKRAAAAKRKRAAAKRRHAAAAHHR
jgi:subtilisin family serine protease